MQLSYSPLLEIRKALQRLAAPPVEQVAHLKDLGVWPSLDELALELDDMLPMLPSLVKDHQITEDQASEICAVNEKLSEMSGSNNVFLWAGNALFDRKEWKEVRKLASVALSQISQAVDPL